MVDVLFRWDCCNGRLYAYITIDHQIGHFVWFIESGSKPKIRWNNDKFPVTLDRNTCELISKFQMSLWNFYAGKSGFIHSQCCEMWQMCYKSVTINAELQCSAAIEGEKKYIIANVKIHMQIARITFYARWIFAPHWFNFDKYWMRFGWLLFCCCLVCKCEKSRIISIFSVNLNEMRMPFKVNDK